jgi:hypothetical protein
MVPMMSASCVDFNFPAKKEKKTVVMPIWLLLPLARRTTHHQIEKRKKRIGQEGK